MGSLLSLPRTQQTNCCRNCETAIKTAMRSAMGFLGALTFSSLNCPRFGFVSPRPVLPTLLPQLLPPPPPAAPPPAAGSVSSCSSNRFMHCGAMAPNTAVAASASSYPDTELGAPAAASSCIVPSLHLVSRSTTGGWLPLSSLQRVGWSDSTVRTRCCTRRPLVQLPAVSLLLHHMCIAWLGRVASHAVLVEHPGTKPSAS
jgi:hypothetical protein